MKNNMIFPKQIGLELTNACNLNCSFCIHKNTKRNISYMDMSLIRKAVNEIKPREDELITPVGLCGIGEPLLHPEFIDIINLFAENNLPYGVGTNGHKLGDYADDLIKAKCKEFVVSIDAVTKETYRKMRGGNFELVIENVKTLLNKLKQAPNWERTYYIQFIVSKINSFETIDFIEYWLKFIKGIFGVKIFIKAVCPFPHIDIEEYYPAPNIKELAGYLSNEQVQICSFDKPITFRDSCPLFDVFIQIHSDGVFSPCCLNIGDEYQIGNFYHSSILELFNSEKMNKYRQLRKQNLISEIPFCRSCT